MIKAIKAIERTEKQMKKLAVIPKRSVQAVRIASKQESRQLEKEVSKYSSICLECGKPLTLESQTHYCSPECAGLKPHPGETCQVTLYFRPKLWEAIREESNSRGCFSPTHYIKELISVGLAETRCHGHGRTNDRQRFPSNNRRVDGYE